MMGRLATGVFLIIMLFAFGGTISNGITNLRTEPITNGGTVITGGGVTSGDVVLTREIFNDNLNNITSITSTDVSDTPTATTYDYLTNTLTIDGLEASQTRTLTIVYRSELVDVFWQAIGPFMPFLIFGGILAAIGYFVWKGGKSRG